MWSKIRKWFGRKTVCIHYKSGRRIRVRCERFAVKRTATSLDEVSWKNISRAPLWLNVNEIESIWVD